MSPFRWWRDRSRRIEASEAKLRKSERLEPAIDFYAAEAADISEWARDRLEANHLTRLFEKTIRERG